jgi:formate dehydrogenase major subunit
VPSLGASFGRGAMTNHWVDLKNAKVFLIGGSNAAENHVISMKWVERAKAQGAKVIHVDPRFNRTSSVADVYARVRPGGDIAYLGAVINYLIANGKFDEEYVKTHTNGLLLANADLAFDDGLFNAFDEEKHKYDTSRWAYDLDEKSRKPKKADRLDAPGTIFSKLADHFARYTMEVAERISGIPAGQIKQIADLLWENRPGTIMYALGMTQHTVGVQNIRCYGILQLLLGNIGVPGGGVNALRGEPNVQGASDMAVLFNYLPGYLSYPNHDEPTLSAWTKKYGTFRAKFLVNGLKAWFGEAATKDNDFGYAWLPKKNSGRDYSIFSMFESAAAGKLKLLYVMGQNPMVTQPNLKLVAQAFAKMEMVVVQDLWETETAAFWQQPGVDPKAIQTEVILLPAAYFMEKEGTVSGSGRLVQWRHQAVKPPGLARNDLDIIDELFNRVRTLVRDSTDPRDLPIRNAAWNYAGPSKSEAVLAEISGRVLRDVVDPKDPTKVILKAGEMVKKIPDLMADGSTSSGAWILAGVMGGPKDAPNLAKRRNSKEDPGGLGIYPKFAWTWPGNIHILYNRAAADKDGKPWKHLVDQKKALVWWDEAKKEWAGFDNPDVAVKTDGPDTPNGQRAFRMNAEGLGRLVAVTYASPQAKPDPKTKDLPVDTSYVPKDGPMPEFYEPVESPVANALHPARQSNPLLKYPRVKGMQPIGTVKDFPYVLMTSSISEHWCAGSTTRNVPWLNELVPEPMIEVPEALAQKLGLRTGDRARVASARGAVEVKAVVTKRMQVMQIAGREVTVVWMPYNWGFKGLSTGPSTNEITIDVGDPNTWCQETKACLVNVTAAPQAVASSATPAGKGA